MPTLAQQQRLTQFAIPQAVDLHCHCLPGMDDGPASMVDALHLCRALVADGITTVVATPHQLGRYDGVNDARQIRSAVASLSAILQEQAIPLRVLPGADVRLDERLVSLIGRDLVMTIADARRYLLLELPHEVFVNPGRLLRELREQGIRTVITHPERHFHIQQDPRRVLAWIEQGACLQVTAGSLVGGFGRTALKTAWELLSSGSVALVAGDAHGVDFRPPSMTAAIEVITSRLGAATARQVCCDNPLRVLDGRDILAPMDAFVSARA